MQLFKCAELLAWSDEDEPMYQPARREADQLRGVLSERPRVTRGRGEYNDLKAPSRTERLERVHSAALEEERTKLRTDRLQVDSASSELVEERLKLP